MEDDLNALPYPIGLIARIFYHCFLSSDNAKNMKVSEIEKSLETYFTNEEIKTAIKVVSGTYKTTNQPTNQPTANSEGRARNGG